MLILSTKITTKQIPSFDPFDVKSELVNLAEDYFQVKNLDLYESGFLGYLIQSLTLLTSDTLYQNSMAYNEAFLNRAILPTSVIEIAKQLDYSAYKITPAFGNLTIVLPISQDSDMLVKIAEGSKVMAGEIPYRVKNNYYIKKDSTGIVISTQDSESGMVSNLPYTVELREGLLSLVFDITIWQIDIYVHEFNFENPTLYVFYEENIATYSGSIFNLIVTVDGEIYKELTSIYQAKPSDRCYEIKIDNITPNLNVKFGNGIYGYLPKINAPAIITIYTTYGSKGNIIANTAEFSERLVNLIDGKIITINSYNSIGITNGQDAESLEDMKRHTVENISSAKRLVTEKDYQGFQGVTGLTNIKAYPILNRRDCVGNDITVYNILFDDKNTPIPTSSIPIVVDEREDILVRQGQDLTYNGYIYKSPFTIELDKKHDLLLARFLYSLQNISVAPSLFLKMKTDDILFGLRQAQIKVYEKTDEFLLTCEVHKLASMDGEKISGHFIIPGALATDPPILDIPITFVNLYEDKTFINVSTENLSSTLIPNDYFDWRIDLYYEDKYYNSYYGNDKWFSLDTTTGIRYPEAFVINFKHIRESEPMIELVHLGVNNITVKTNDAGYYVFYVYVSKLKNNKAHLINCSLLIENSIISLNEDLTFDGETIEDERQENNVSKTNASLVKFKSPAISPEDIPSDIVDFKIELSYDNETYSIYKQNTIFHHELTNIFFSNIGRHMLDKKLYAWSIPVIEKEYYENNIVYLDRYVFSMFAYLSSEFNKYKMLTDRVSMKFARTFGRSINMRLNKYTNIPSKLYEDDFYINLPPDIKVLIYISKNTKNSIPNIIDECKNVLYTFLQLKANFNTNIYRSEMSRFLHDVVDDVEFCEILEPTDDIVYHFNIEDIPRYARHELYEYCPEYIWFDKNKINIEVKFIN